MASAPKKAPKAYRSTMDTLIVSLDQANGWKTPPFQRPIRVNDSVRRIAEEMKISQAITGMITLGKLTKDNSEYVVDGQHRIEAFRISGLPEVIADVRVVHFDDMADMSEEFVRLNTHLVGMRPDDLLRGLAPTMAPLRYVMDQCPYVGFDNIRRGSANAMVSLAAIIRCWNASESDSPSSASRYSISHVAAAFNQTSAETLVDFMNHAHAAWGRDVEYHRLWGNLNITMCMWMYRRVVLDTVRKGNNRVTVLTDKEFRECLMSVSADANYLAWLPGRLLRETDRSPSFMRIKAAFSKRLLETKGKVFLPQPAWSSK